MKKITGILVLLLLVLNNIQAQSNYKIFADFGVKYTPLEYLGGPVAGISLENPDKKLSFNYRKDIIFSIGKYSYENYSGYKLTDYNTYDYLDFAYKLKTKLKIFAGVGWIYNGKNENIKLNRQHGYSSASLGLNYPTDWLTLEVRGDIPLINYNKAVDSDFLFPVSFALYYHFSPKK
jgi:hypothetical protein